jgi:hypothetical protein
MSSFQSSDSVQRSQFSAEEFSSSQEDVEPGLGNSIGEQGVTAPGSPGVTAPGGQQPQQDARQATHESSQQGPEAKDSSDDATIAHLHLPLHAHALFEVKTAQHVHVRSGGRSRLVFLAPHRWQQGQHPLAFDGLRDEWIWMPDDKGTVSYSTPTGATQECTFDGETTRASFLAREGREPSPICP